MQTRIVARAVVYDAEKNSILLVRNRDDEYWYIPGGGWEADKENILECAAREVKEETGLEVEMGKFLYLQEFHASPERVIFEGFWLASVIGSAVLDENHVDTDPDGVVGEARWFTRDEVAKIIVYPEIFMNAFWDDIRNMINGEERFLGANWNRHE